MDNRIEFIEQLKKIIKEYNIINCNDTPEAMAEEVAKAIESALFDYQRKKIIGVEGQIVDEYNQLMKDATNYGNKSNINHILTYGNLYSFLKEGESSKDKRITRLDSKYAIYRDNNTGEYIGVFRNLNDKSQALIIRIREGKDPLISYHELQGNSSNYNREDILKKIANTKIEKENIDGKEKIFDNKSLIDLIVKKPLISNGKTTFGNRLKREDVDGIERYIDIIENEIVKVVRYDKNNVLLIKINEKGKITKRYFIKGTEVSESYFNNFTIKILLEEESRREKQSSAETIQSLVSVRYIDELVKNPMKEKEINGLIFRVPRQDMEIYMDIETLETLTIYRQENITIVEMPTKELIYYDNGKRVNSINEEAIKKIKKKL